MVENSDFDKQGSVINLMLLLVLLPSLLLASRIKIARSQSGPHNFEPLDCHAIGSTEVEEMNSRLLKLHLAQAPVFESSEGSSSDLDGERKLVKQIFRKHS